MGVPEMANVEQCSVTGCEQAVAATLEGQALCGSHFISTSYTRLEQYDVMRKEHRLGAADTESVRRFINQCSRQADEIEHGTKYLDNLDRARLLHLILWANELGSHLRRSPRKVASVSVRLCCDKLGNAWEEETQTLLLSRYGALLRCSHSAKPGEAVQLVRLDTGQAVHGRVAWQHLEEREGVRIGIEFLDCENFWGLDWGAIEETR
jgi:hypothetical protein